MRPSLWRDGKGAGQSERVRELRSEEQWAARMVEAALGLPVRQHDDDSRPGMHDLDIVRPDGSVAAIEVTAAVDRDSIQLWKLVNNCDERWIVPSLRGGWMVFLEPTARAKRVFAELPALLADLEAGNVQEIGTSVRKQDQEAPLLDRAGRLGIVHGRQGGTSYPGSIYVSIELPHERRGGFVSTSGDVVPSWVTTFLADPEQLDVRVKLDRSGSDERHALVILPGFTTVPFGVSDLLWRDDDSIPSAAPLLPREVTHVWLVTTWAVGTGLRWAPGSGWQRFSKLLD